MPVCECACVSWCVSLVSGYWAEGKEKKKDPVGQRDEYKNDSPSAQRREGLGAGCLPPSAGRHLLAVCTRNMAAILVKCFAVWMSTKLQMHSGLYGGCGGSVPESHRHQCACRANSSTGGWVPNQHHSAGPCFSSFRVLVGREQCSENCGFATDFQDLICPNDYSA